MNNNQTTQAEYPAHKHLKEHAEQYDSWFSVSKDNVIAVDSEFQHLQARLKQAEELVEYLKGILIHTDAMRLMDNNEKLALQETMEASATWCERLIQIFLANYQANKEGK